MKARRKRREESVCEESKRGRGDVGSRFTREEVLSEGDASSARSLVKKAAEQDIPQQLRALAPAQPVRHDPLGRHSRADRPVSESGAADSGRRRKHTRALQGP
eukprot:766298-Hanusia_phi.AAC.8